jgi:hypothetical protein
VNIVRVICDTAGCRARGVARDVQLPPAGVDVVFRPAILCAVCERLVREIPMPKITVHGGPSNAAAEPEPEPSETPAAADQVAEPEPPAADTSEAEAPPAPAPRSRTRTTKTTSS